MEQSMFEPIMVLFFRVESIRNCYKLINKQCCNENNILGKFIDQYLIIPDGISLLLFFSRCIHNNKICLWYLRITWVAFREKQSHPSQFFNSFSKNSFLQKNIFSEKKKMIWLKRAFDMHFVAITEYWKVLICFSIDLHCSASSSN